MASPKVELQGVSKRFIATQALQDVSLTLAHGETERLVGENGAGKSTLVEILAGIHQPDSGQSASTESRPSSAARRDARRSASRSSTRSHGSSPT